MKKVKIPWHCWFPLFVIMLSYLVLFSEGSVSSREWVSAAVGLIGTFSGLILAVMQNYLREKAMDALGKAERENQENARLTAEYKSRLEDKIIPLQERLNTMERKITEIYGDIKARRIAEEESARSCKQLLEMYSEGWQKAHEDLESEESI